MAHTRIQVRSGDNTAAHLNPLLAASHISVRRKQHGRLEVTCRGAIGASLDDIPRRVLERAHYRIIITLGRTRQLGDGLPFDFEADPESFGWQGDRVTFELRPAPGEAGNRGTAILAVLLDRTDPEATVPYTIDIEVTSRGTERPRDQTFERA